MVAHAAIMVAHALSISKETMFQFLRYLKNELAETLFPCFNPNIVLLIFSTGHSIHVPGLLVKSISI